MKSNQNKKAPGAKETIIDLPEVKDIPGQERVKAPPAGMLGDTTISSSDEEGEAIFNDADEETGMEPDGDEKKDTPDQKNLSAAGLDSTDDDGEPLNEKSSATDLSGEDLDVPGAELDDGEEAIGEEDEENNSYSRADN